MWHGLARKAIGGVEVVYARKEVGEQCLPA